jgi:hypothetical protein
MSGGRAFPIRSLFAALSLLFAASAPSHAQQADLESAVKATFLLRFGSFAEWPASAFDSPSAPLVICIAGAEPFAATVEAAAVGEQISGRSIQVRRLGAVSAASRCHILYAAGVAGQSPAAMMRIMRGAPVLTVTDARFGETRGAIHFVVVEGRVRFHIDRGEAERNRLGLNARLLSIALSVRRRGGGVR